jgi:hypothetical protein
MRLRTLLVLSTAACATFAPAASASIASPPDWNQAGPAPWQTQSQSFVNGCFTSAFRPFRTGGTDRGIAAEGGVVCFRPAQSISVLVCTDINAPNSVWPVGGLTDGWSWRPISCTAAPDATGAWRLGARDLNSGAGCSATYPWWPSNPTVRTEVVTQVTAANGATSQTVNYSQPQTIGFRGSCPSSGGGGGSNGGGGVVAS